MGKVKSFKQEFTFDDRLGESKNIIVKYPDRVPVIIERYSRTDLPEMEKRKYLVPREMTIGQFIHILSSRLELTPGKALFIFVKNTLPQTASQMDSMVGTPDPHRELHNIWSKTTQDDPVRHALIGRLSPFWGPFHCLLFYLFMLC